MAVRFTNRLNPLEPTLRCLFVAGSFPGQKLNELSSEPLKGPNPSDLKTWLRVRIGLEAETVTKIRHRGLGSPGPTVSGEGNRNTNESLKKAPRYESAGHDYSTSHSEDGTGRSDIITSAKKQEREFFGVVNTVEPGYSKGPYALDSLLRSRRIETCLRASGGFPTLPRVRET